MKLVEDKYPNPRKLAYNNTYKGDVVCGSRLLRKYENTYNDHITIHFTENNNKMNKKLIFFT